MLKSSGATADVTRCIKNLVTPSQKSHIHNSNLFVKSTRLSMLPYSSVKCKGLKYINKQGVTPCLVANSDEANSDDKEKEEDEANSEEEEEEEEEGEEAEEEAEDKAEEKEEEKLTYKDAGVDIDAGSELVRRIAKMVSGIGGFGGLFPLGDSYLVAGTDGVGTKLKLAFETQLHETIGIDLVAMSVNDIVTSGAKPLFFLDYFATSHLDVDLAEKVIKGIVDGCQLSDCALLGGETAEMPGFYQDGEYDLSGFAVGIVKKDEVINGKNIKVGDVLIGLPSSGVHSNGFSLVRRVIQKSGLSLKDTLPSGSATLGEALMAPTVIYVKQVLDIISKGGVKGIAHVTGGGFTDNIPRVFPEGVGALIYKGSWKVPPVFKWIQEAGQIEDAEMRRTFNMGIGMVLVMEKDAANRILEESEKTNTEIYRIGEVIKGDGVSY